MAMSLPEVATDFGWLFPFAYLVVRIVGIRLQWLLVEDDEGWSSAVRRWTVMSSFGLVAIAVAVVVAPEYRFLALGIAALFDVVRRGTGGARRVAPQ